MCFGVAVCVWVRFSAEIQPHSLLCLFCVQAQAVISVKLLEITVQNFLPISLMHFVQVLCALGDRLLH